MTKRILIDAGHPEETRVVLVDENKLDEFDHERRDDKPLKGNIYLAKVTRVEPSLQAAFVDYGGNRHGFLPFAEIHPDYYRLPVEDREALMAEVRAAHAQAARAETDNDGGDPEETAGSGGARRLRVNQAESAPSESRDDDTAVEEVETTTDVETLAGDELEDAARRRAAMLGRYKIQEVIKRRQVMLVQVVKEERGTKGAALSTYLSIAGRYCVLMPNTERGGGVSRKIATAKDRKRLKQVLSELNIPEGMSVIVRTAGSDRSKVEIRRDYDHLLRLWDHIRDTTLQSLAPSLIYEEANLIKRTIRDLYTRDIDRVLVEGDEGYRAAKSFMRSLIPSHAKRVQKHDDPRVPLFHSHGVETQLDNIHNPAVQLSSGGFIIINQTEALVAIDVNSGKATKERHIEETALKTNLEAAEEIARQLKLRDLAGLIVIDFIDMEVGRHNRDVEQRLKEAMKRDRARIQLGRISPFGLLELSRQRLRPSLHETSTDVCQACGGSGFVRSRDSTALHVLRALEEEGINRGGGEVTLTVPPPIALYILNDKRDRLIDIEHRYGFRARVATDETLVPPAYRLERVRTDEPAAEGEAAPDPEPEQSAQQPSEQAPQDQSAPAKPRKRSRRGGRKKREDASTDADADADAQADAPDGGGDDARGRRRGKRGGQRRARRNSEETAAEQADATNGNGEASAGGQDTGDAADAPAPVAEATSAGDAAAAADPAVAGSQAESGGDDQGGATRGKRRASRTSGGRSRRREMPADSDSDSGVGDADRAASTEETGGVESPDPTPREANSTGGGSGKSTRRRGGRSRRTRRASTKTEEAVQEDAAESGSEAAANRAERGEAASAPAAPTAPDPADPAQAGDAADGDAEAASTTNGEPAAPAPPAGAVETPAVSPGDADRQPDGPAPRRAGWWQR